LRRLSTLKSELVQLYSNLRGWKTSRKLLVIESDDWGAIRMPSVAVYEALLSAGIRVDRSPYDKIDCLESREDFELLMEVLADHKDGVGENPVMTFNTVMGNPDFEKIKKDNFSVFHHEHFFDSYKKYRGDNLKTCWQSAIDLRLIFPQFHGREHLNSQLWLRDLRAGHPETTLAFEHGFYGLPTRTSSVFQSHYCAAFSAESSSQLESMKEILADGMDQFENTFGFPSRTFVACNYVLPEEIEEHMASLGVKAIQTQRGYMRPLPSRGGKRKKVFRHTGQKNRFGQHFTVRNVLFEPYIDANQDWAAIALNQIETAFRFNRPAIICSHRINYVGSNGKNTRDRALGQLSKLLAEITKRWPEVEFCSSDRLLDIMTRSSDSNILPDENGQVDQRAVES